MEEAQDLAGPRSVGVTMLLCDSAQVAARKLFILGGGLATVGPNPQPVALALLLDIPWDRANISHEWAIDLVDEDGQPIMIGDKALQLRGKVESGRPAGARPGSPQTVPIAINMGALRLPGNRRYTFQLSIQNESRPDWRVSFNTRPIPASQQQQQNKPASPPTA
ncbi:MAG: DUF6941 family protein [Acidimicrobiales bacterium]|jgi:hypothetical protein